MNETAVTRFRLLGVPLAATTMESAIETVLSWIERGEKGRMVTFSNVHMLVEGLRNPKFFGLLRASDINFPDGMPLVWFGRRKTGKAIERICGPEFLPAFSAATEEKHLRHFFYGGAAGVAAKAAEELQRLYPGVEIAGAYSPPFRPITAEEDAAIVQTINAARPDVIWVCLGCPKQENWIEEHRARLNASVLLAVGLAVDVLAGSKKRAPDVLCNFGLEWLYRLCQEPRRLWRRYLVYNSIFLFRLLRELFGQQRHLNSKV